MGHPRLPLLCLASQGYQLLAADMPEAWINPQDSAGGEQQWVVTGRQVGASVAWNLEPSLPHKAAKWLQWMPLKGDCAASC